MGSHAAFAAGGSYGLTASRPHALRGLIYNQAPGAGRCAHKCLRRSGRFAPEPQTGNVPARSIFPYCRIPLIPNQPWIIGENLMNTGANTMHTMLISLIRIFSAGPLVSLQGSPTVSPITAAP